MLRFLETWVLINVVYLNVLAMDSSLIVTFLMLKLFRHVKKITPEGTVSQNFFFRFYLIKKNNNF